MTKEQLIVKALDTVPLKYHYMTYDEMLKCSKKGLEMYLKTITEEYHHDLALRRIEK